MIGEQVPGRFDAERKPDSGQQEQKQQQAARALAQQASRLALFLLQGALQGSAGRRPAGTLKRIPSGLQLIPGGWMIRIASQPALEGTAFCLRQRLLGEANVPLGCFLQCTLRWRVLCVRTVPVQGFGRTAHALMASESRSAWWQCNSPWATYFLTMLTLTPTSAAISACEAPSRRNIRNARRGFSGRPSRRRATCSRIST